MHAFVALLRLSSVQSILVSSMSGCRHHYHHRCILHYDINHIIEVCSLASL